MSDKLDMIEVNTRFTIDNKAIRVIAIEAREFIGGWDVYVRYDWSNIETGEERCGLEGRLSGFLSDLEKYGIVEHSKID